MAKDDDRDDEETESTEDEAEASDEETDGSDDSEESDDSDEESSDDDSDDESSDDDSDDESSDDDDSDEESSDDDAGEESSDESSEDEESSADEESEDAEEEEDEEPARPAKAKSAKGKKARGKQGERMTAGARLAAAKAAKAARKAAKLGKDIKDEREPLAQLESTGLGQSIEKAGAWAGQNRMAVYAIVAALVLGIGGWIGWHSYSESQAREAGALLADAVELSEAAIRAEDAPEPGDDDPPSFTSTTARAEAALAAYQDVVARYPGSEAASWAQLGAGNSLLELERYDDARAAFEAAAHQSDPSIVWRALEGKGFTYEAQEEWDQAIEVYQELSRLDDNRFEPVAKYHIARMYIAKGETEQATETLTALVDQQRGAADDEEKQEFAYVLAQAEIRLRELDPSAAPARPSLGGANPLGGGGPSLGGGGGGDPLGGAGGGDISQEQLQELIRRFQQQQQQGGGAPPPE